MSGSSDQLYNQFDLTCTPLSSLVQSQENLVLVTSTIPGCVRSDDMGTINSAQITL